MLRNINLLFKLNCEHVWNVRGLNTTLNASSNVLKPDIRVKNLEKPIKASKNKDKENNVIFSEKLNLKYTKYQLHDPYLYSLMQLAKSKKQRNEKHQIVCEGYRLIKDAIEADFKLNYLLCNKIENLDPLIECLQGSEAEIIKVPMHDLKNWTCLTTCPGIIGIFEKREIKQQKNTLPVTIICDNIREPNNLGSIIRLAAALPCSQIITTKGCTDAWDAKCLRGGSGGHFQIQILGSVSWLELTSLVHTQPHQVFLADNNLDNYSNEQILEYSQLPSLSPSDQIFVIIGGETHGISEEALSFAKRANSWNCVNIPLAKNINSLNTTSALAIILFEIRKKIQTSNF